MYFSDADVEELGNGVQSHVSFVADIGIITSVSDEFDIIEHFSWRVLHNLITYNYKNVIPTIV